MLQRSFHLFRHIKWSRDKYIVRVQALPGNLLLLNICHWRLILIFFVFVFLRLFEIANIHLWNFIFELNQDRCMRVPLKSIERPVTVILQFLILLLRWAWNRCFDFLLSLLFLGFHPWLFWQHNIVSIAHLVAYFVSFLLSIFKLRYLRENATNAIKLVVSHFRVLHNLR